MKHLLIVGRSGVGKTTLMQRVVKSLRGCPIDGFLTEEFRDGPHRMGFWLSSLDGRQILLAYRKTTSGQRVGPYKVNVDVLSDVGVSIIKRAAKHALILFLDELGKMELSSSVFMKAVEEAFNKGCCIVATAGISPIPFVSELKKRKDVELIPLTASNREDVEEELVERLKAVCADDERSRVLQRQANHISEMIVSGDVPQIDIQIQQSALREAMMRAFPDQEGLYRLLCETRFRRLWQQFRSHDTAH